MSTDTRNVVEDSIERTKTNKNGRYEASQGKVKTWECTKPTKKVKAETNK